MSETESSREDLLKAAVRILRPDNSSHARQTIVEVAEKWRSLGDPRHWSPRPSAKELRTASTRAAGLTMALEQISYFDHETYRSDLALEKGLWDMGELREYLQALEEKLRVAERSNRGGRPQHIKESLLVVFCDILFQSLDKKISWSEKRRICRVRWIHSRICNRREKRLRLHNKKIYQTE